MARNYRRTPKQAAASRRNLAKARARRRRRNIAIGTGVGVLAVAGGLGAGIGIRYAQGLRGGPKRPSAFTPKHQLALPPGRGKVINLDVGKRTDSLIKEFDKGAKKAATRRQKTFRRGLKNSRRRQRYWAGKPVAKVNYVIKRRTR